ncbi:metallophosphoesterase family protein [Paenibacillus sp. GYB003]|uniref:metallophosphoesterase family protein n=1 Tax=Paenibacillus sp. GYB003 TaxID=2994392 RepID=UPI002F96154C
MLSIVKGPYLQRPAETGMTFMWETSEPASSRVNVFAAERIHSGHQGNYKTPERLVRTAGSDDDRTIHRIDMDGLEPATAYFYTVISENARGKTESGPHPFKTAVRKGEPFCFAVTSETGGYSGFDQTNGIINRNLFGQMQNYRPDLALFIGDMVNDGRQYDDWSAYLFNPGRGLLWNTPFYSCLGNHECNASWYYDFFAYDPPKNYYSFDYGDVHFVCLDSTDFVKREHYPNAAGTICEGNPQYDFLVRDLQAASAKWNIVYFHYPPYVSGGYQVEDLRQLCPVLERHGVDLVFNSHTIVYERSHPLRDGRVDMENGIVYVVAGGAGAMPDWLLPKREWHTSQSLAVPHFVQVSVVSDRLELRAIDVEGRLFDTLQIRKAADGGKTFR